MFNMDLTLVIVLMLCLHVQVLLGACGNPYKWCYYGTTSSALEFNILTITDVSFNDAVEQCGTLSARLVKHTDILNGLQSTYTAAEVADAWIDMQCTQGDCYDSSGVPLTVDDTLFASGSVPKDTTTWCFALDSTSKLVKLSCSDKYDIICRRSYFPVPRWYTGEKDLEFSVFSLRAKYDDAVTLCERAGSTLAYLPSSGFVRTATSYFPSLQGVDLSGPDGGVWVGLRGTTGNYKWDGGYQGGFSRVQPGGTGECIFYDADNGGLFARSCDDELHVICVRPSSYLVIVSSDYPSTTLNRLTAFTVKISPEILSSGTITVTLAHPSIEIPTSCVFSQSSGPTCVTYGTPNKALVDKPTPSAVTAQCVVSTRMFRYQLRTPLPTLYVTSLTGVLVPTVGSSVVGIPTLTQAYVGQPVVIRVLVSDYPGTAKWSYIELVPSFSVPGILKVLSGKPGGKVTTVSLDIDRLYWNNINAQEYWGGAELYVTSTKAATGFFNLGNMSGGLQIVDDKTKLPVGNIPFTFLEGCTMNVNVSTSQTVLPMTTITFRRSLSCVPKKAYPITSIVESLIVDNEALDLDNPYVKHLSPLGVFTVDFTPTVTFNDIIMKFLIPVKITLKFGITKEMKDELNCWAAPSVGAGGSIDDTGVFLPEATIVINVEKGKSSLVRPLMTVVKNRWGAVGVTLSAPVPEGYFAISLVIPAGSGLSTNMTEIRWTSSSPLTQYIGIKGSSLYTGSLDWSVVSKSIDSFTLPPAVGVDIKDMYTFQESNSTVRLIAGCTTSIVLSTQGNESRVDFMTLTPSSSTVKLIPPSFQMAPLPIQWTGQLNMTAPNTVGNNTVSFTMSGEGSSDFVVPSPITVVVLPKRSVTISNTTVSLVGIDSFFISIDSVNRLLPGESMKLTGTLDASLQACVKVQSVRWSEFDAFTNKSLRVDSIISTECKGSITFSLNVDESPSFSSVLEVSRVQVEVVPKLVCSILNPAPSHIVQDVTVNYTLSRIRPFAVTVKLTSNCSQSDFQHPTSVAFSPNEITTVISVVGKTKTVVCTLDIVTEGMRYEQNADKNLTLEITDKYHVTLEPLSWTNELFIGEKNAQWISIDFSTQPSPQGELTLTFEQADQFKCVPNSVFITEKNASTTVLVLVIGLSPTAFMQFVSFNGWLSSVPGYMSDQYEYSPNHQFTVLSLNDVNPIANFPSRSIVDEEMEFTWTCSPYGTAVVTLQVSVSDRSALELVPSSSNFECTTGSNENRITYKMKKTGVLTFSFSLGGANASIFSLNNRTEIIHNVTANPDVSFDPALTTTDQLIVGTENALTTKITASGTSAVGFTVKIESNCSSVILKITPNEITWKKATPLEQSVTFIGYQVEYCTLTLTTTSVKVSLVQPDPPDLRIYFTPVLETNLTQLLPSVYQKQPIYFSIGSTYVLSGDSPTVKIDLSGSDESGASVPSVCKASSGALYYSVTLSHNRPVVVVMIITESVGTCTIRLTTVRGPPKYDDSTVNGILQTLRVQMFETVSVITTPLPTFMFIGSDNAITLTVKQSVTTPMNMTLSTKTKTGCGQVIMSPGVVDLSFGQGTFTLTGVKPATQCNMDFDVFPNTAPGVEMYGVKSSVKLSRFPILDLQQVVLKCSPYFEVGKASKVLLSLITTYGALVVPQDLSVTLSTSNPSFVLDVDTVTWTSSSLEQSVAVSSVTDNKGKLIANLGGKDAVKFRIESSLCPSLTAYVPTTVIIDGPTPDIMYKGVKNSFTLVLKIEQKGDYTLQGANFSVTPAIEGYIEITPRIITRGLGEFKLMFQLRVVNPIGSLRMQIICDLQDAPPNLPVVTLPNPFEIHAYDLISIQKQEPWVDSAYMFQQITWTIVSESVRPNSVAVYSVNTSSIQCTKLGSTSITLKSEPQQSSSTTLNVTALCIPPVNPIKICLTFDPLKSTDTRFVESQCYTLKVLPLNNITFFSKINGTNTVFPSTLYVRESIDFTVTLPSPVKTSLNISFGDSSKCIQYRPAWYIYTPSVSIIAKISFQVRCATPRTTMFLNTSGSEALLYFPSYVIQTNVFIRQPKQIMTNIKPPVTIFPGIENILYFQVWITEPPDTPMKVEIITSSPYLMYYLEMSDVDLVFPNNTADVVKTFNISGSDDLADMLPPFPVLNVSFVQKTNRDFDTLFQAANFSLTMHPLLKLTITPPTKMFAGERNSKSFELSVLDMNKYIPNRNAFILECYGDDVVISPPLITLPANQEKTSPPPTVYSPQPGQRQVTCNLKTDQPFPPFLSSEKPYFIIDVMPKISPMYFIEDAYQSSLTLFEMNKGYNNVTVTVTLGEQFILLRRTISMDLILTTTNPNISISSNSIQFSLSPQGPNVTFVNFIVYGTGICKTAIAAELRTSFTDMSMAEFESTTTLPVTVLPLYSMYSPDLRPTYSKLDVLKFEIVAPTPPVDDMHASFTICQEGEAKVLGLLCPSSCNVVPWLRGSQGNSLRQTFTVFVEPKALEQPLQHFICRLVGTVSGDTTYSHTIVNTTFEVTPPPSFVVAEYPMKYKVTDLVKEGISFEVDVLWAELKVDKPPYTVLLSDPTQSLSESVMVNIRVTEELYNLGNNITDYFRITYVSPTKLKVQILPLKTSQIREQAIISLIFTKQILKNVTALESVTEHVRIEVSPGKVDFLDVKTQEALFSATAAVSVVGSLGSMGGATSMGKAKAVMDSIDCPQENWRSEVQDIDFEDNPTRIEVDTSDSYVQQALPALTGITFANLGIVILAASCHGGLVGVIYTYRKARKYKITSLHAAMAVARFPSYLLFPLLLFYQSTVRNSVKVTLYSDVWFAKTACFLVFALYTMVIPACILYVVRPSTFQAQFHKLKSRQYFILGIGEWISTDATYISRFGMIFDSYRPPYQWFLLADVATVMVLGIVEAFEPLTVDACIGRQTILVATFGLQCITIIRLQPYNLLLDTWFFGAISLVQSLSSMVILIGQLVNRGTSRSPGDFPPNMYAAYAVVAASMTLSLRTLVDLWLLFQSIVNEDSHETLTTLQERAFVFEDGAQSPRDADTKVFELAEEMVEFGSDRKSKKKRHHQRVHEEEVQIKALVSAPALRMLYGDEELDPDELAHSLALPKKVHKDTVKELMNASPELALQHQELTGHPRHRSMTTFGRSPAQHMGSISPPRRQHMSRAGGDLNKTAGFIAPSVKFTARKKETLGPDATDHRGRSHHHHHHRDNLDSEPQQRDHHHHHHHYRANTSPSHRSQVPTSPTGKKGQGHEWELL
eukprot:PhF_6_TR38590/c0_g1_i2/m.57374